MPTWTRSGTLSWTSTLALNECFDQLRLIRVDDLVDATLMLFKMATVLSLAIATGAPDTAMNQWDAGYTSITLDNLPNILKSLFGVARRQGFSALEKPDQAVEESACTKGGPCSVPTSFELAAEAQSKSILSKKARSREGPPPEAPTQVLTATCS